MLGAPDVSLRLASNEIFDKKLISKTKPAVQWTPEQTLGQTGKRWNEPRLGLEAPGPKVGLA